MTFFRLNFCSPSLLAGLCEHRGHDSPSYGLVSLSKVDARKSWWLCAKPFSWMPRRFTSAMHGLTLPKPGRPCHGPRNPRAASISRSLPLRRVETPQRSTAIDLPGSTSLASLSWFRPDCRLQSPCIPNYSPSARKCCSVSWRSSVAQLCHLWLRAVELAQNGYGPHPLGPTEGEPCDAAVRSVGETSRCHDGSRGSYRRALHQWLGA